MSISEMEACLENGNSFNRSVVKFYYVIFVRGGNEVLYVAILKVADGVHVVTKSINL